MIQLREITTGKTVTSSPAVAGGKVYVGSLDGYFYALNAFPGSLTLAWREFLGRQEFGSSATIANGVTKGLIPTSTPVAYRSFLNERHSLRYFMSDGVCLWTREFAPGTVSSPDVAFKGIPRYS